MMTEIYPIPERHKIANEVACEAIDTLMSVYRADSFNAELLQTQLTEAIALSTAKAQLFRDLGVAPTNGEDMIKIARIQQCSESDDMQALPPDGLAQPFLDLRDRPSPNVLRVLAIGSPQVVNNFVMTLFRWNYARPEEWSRQLPTINPGEVMRILTKRIVSR